MAKYPPSVYANFLSHVKTGPVDQCWEWQGHIHGNGYGRFNLRGKTKYAHRFAYELFIGEPADGLDVCHRCDNRKCVNPMHLWQGTRSENMRDCVAKGRNRPVRGIPYPEVVAICDMLNGGKTTRQIADALGYPRYTITRIKSKKSYRQWTNGVLK